MGVSGFQSHAYVIVNCGKRSAYVLTCKASGLTSNIVTWGGKTRKTVESRKCEPISFWYHVTASQVWGKRSEFVNQIWKCLFQSDASRSGQNVSWVTTKVIRLMLHSKLQESSRELEKGMTLWIGKWQLSRSRSLIWGKTQKLQWLFFLRNDYNKFWNVCT